MKFIFIRHAKDDDKYRGGWSNLDITDEGRTQALKLAKYLKENGLNISKIISSDLKRAVTTSEIINTSLNLPILYDKCLREINNGELSGMLNEEACNKYPGLYFKSLDMDSRYPNGESPREFYDRINKWFKETISLYKDEKQNILFVTHGGVINIIYYIINNKEWDNKKESYKIPTCSIHILDIDKMKFEKNT